MTDTQVREPVAAPGPGSAPPPAGPGGAP
ncbi:MAG: hypothetical protein AVDCRST_MAG48-3242, partial [uncultured Friedmanniella sp.]